MPGDHPRGLTLPSHALSGFRRRNPATMFPNRSIEAQPKPHLCCSVSPASLSLEPSVKRFPWKTATLTHIGSHLKRGGGISRHGSGTKECFPEYCVSILLACTLACRQRFLIEVLSSQAFGCVTKAMPVAERALLACLRLPTQGTPSMVRQPCFF